MFLAFIINRANACDACGCDISSRIFPTDSKTYLGLGHQVGYYNGKHGHPGESIYSRSKEVFNRTDLFVKYAPNNRIEFIGQIPWVNYYIYSNSYLINNISGLADATLLGRYIFLSKIKCPTSHRLAMGAGLKLPTGKYIANINTDNPNYQPGSGTVDYIFNVNYSYRKNDDGLRADVNYRYNTTNKNQIKKGNLFAGIIEYFHTKELGRNTKSIIYTGIGLENVSKDKLPVIKDFTPSTRLYGELTAGGDIYYKKMFASLRIKTPVLQSRNDFQLPYYGTVNISVGFML